MKTTQNFLTSIGITVITNAPNLINSQITQTQMQTFLLILTPLITFVFSFWIIYYLDKTKNKTIKILENSIEFIRLYQKMIHTIEKRKIQFLYKCIRAGKDIQLKEPKYLNDFEIELLVDLSKKIGSNIEDLYKELNIGIEDEHN